jgi:uncharacterized small protein (DUF1192 family)
MLPSMDDDDRPDFSGGVRNDAAQRLASESLDRYSQDELEARILLLEQEITRVRLRLESASATRLAAEALFRPHG